MCIQGLGWEIGCNHSKDLWRIEIREREPDSFGSAQFRDE